jgi:drug/metabolite transporter (DMT)-like permease
MYIITVLVLAIFLINTLSVSPGHENIPPNILSTVMGFMALHLFTIATAIGLEIFYVIQIFRGGRVPKEKQIMWLALLGFLGLVTLPIFWYYYIWPETTNN